MKKRTKQWLAVGVLVGMLGSIVGGIWTWEKLSKTDSSSVVTRRTLPDFLSGTPTGDVYFYDYQTEKETWRAIGHVSLQKATTTTKRVRTGRWVPKMEKVKVEVPVWKSKTDEGSSSTSPQSSLNPKESNRDKGDEETQVHSLPPTQSVDKLQKQKVVIRKGDTMWALQEKAAPHHNVLDLLSQLRAINRSLGALHPVYPGDQRWVLREVKKAPKKASITKDTDTVWKWVMKGGYRWQEETKNMTTKTARFIYEKESVPRSSIWVNSEMSEAFIQVGLNGKQLAILNTIPAPNLRIHSFEERDGTLYVLDEKQTTLYALSDKQRPRVIWKGKEEPVHDWTVAKGWIWINQGSQLTQIQLSTPQHTKTIEIGDAVKDMVLVKDRLWVLTRFGTGLSYNALFAVNPNTLDVTNGLQLDGQEIRLLARNGQDALYVASRKRSQSGEKGAPVVTKIDPSTFKKQKLPWEVAVSSEVWKWGDRIVGISPGVLQTWKEYDGTLQNEQAIKGTYVFPISK